MPHGQHSQRMPIAGSDRNYRVIDSKTTYPRVSLPSEFNVPVTHQIPSKREKRTTIYQDHRHEYPKRQKYLQEVPPSVAAPPRRIIYHGTVSQAPPRRRRLWYSPPQSNVKIFDQKPKWHGQAKVDTHNKGSVQRLQSYRRPVILNEATAWAPNPEFETHVEYLKNTRKKPPQERRVNTNNVTYTDGYLVYDEQTGQYYPVRLPPTENRNLARPRRYRQAPSNNGRHDRWHYINPKVNSHNEVLADYIEGQPRPQIFGEQPRWRSRPKVDTYNGSYNPNRSSYRPIFNSKPRWHAQSKIDTGFLPDDYW